MKERLISIVMPVFERPAFIEEAVESVLAQGHAAWELVVVDDGSRMPAVHRILERIEAIARVRVLRKPNGGPASAVNLGVREASGEHVCRLDSDDLLCPDALATVAAAIDARPEVSYFYSSRHVIDERSRRIVRTSVSPDGVYRSIPFDPETLRERYICNHLICWRRRDFLAVGGMDERLRWAEDWELALRMAAAELAFQHIPEPLYCVREYAGSRLTNDTPEAEKARIEAELRAPDRASA